MSVILYYVIFIFASTARLGSDYVRVSQPVGTSPRYRPLRITRSSNNVARLALTMCPDLEKLHSYVVLLAGMQRNFWVACATIVYLKDAWAQYWREDVCGGGEFIHSEWKSFTSRSILSIPSLHIGWPLLVELRYPPHTRSRSTEAWTGASQGLLGCALLPSSSSSLLSSSVDVNKYGPALPVLIVCCLCSPFLRACGLQGLPSCQPTAWTIFWRTHNNSLLHSSITPAHSKLPSPISLSLITCTRMISSTAICSFKLSSQSKWRHPTTSAPTYYVNTFTYCTTNVPYHRLVMGYSLHIRQYWGGSIFIMLCPMQCCAQCRGCAVVALWRRLYTIMSGIQHK